MTAHILSPSATLLGILDTVLSLPNAKQLVDGEFNLDELSKRLTGALSDESQRNEIIKLTGDNALLVLECLDKVSEVKSCPQCRILITL